MRTPLSRSLITDLNRISKIHYFPFTSNSYFPEVRCWQGHTVEQLIEAKCYKPEGRGFDSERSHWNYSLTWSFRPHYGPAVDSAFGSKGGRCVELTTLSPSEILGASTSSSLKGLSRPEWNSCTFFTATGWTVRESNSGGRGARFSAPVQTAPGAHPASYTMGTESLYGGVKWPGRGLEHPPHLAPRLKKE